MNDQRQPRWFEFDLRWLVPVRHGLRLYTGCAARLWRVTLPLVATAALIGFIVTVLATPADSTILNGAIEAPPGSSTAGYTHAQWLSLALQMLGAVLVAAVELRVFSEAARGRQHESADVLAFAVRRFGATLWVLVLTGVLAAVGLVALVLPGIYVATLLSLSLPVLGLEERRGGEALRRSRELVRGYVGHTFSANLVGLLAVVAPFLLLRLLVPANGSVTGHLFAGLLINVFVGVVFGPVLLAVQIALYFDLRGRKEPGSAPVVLIPAPSAATAPRGPTTADPNP